MDVYTYTITNNGTGQQELSSVTGVIRTDGAGGVYDTVSNTWVDGCSASWFNVVVSPPSTLPQDVNPGATAASTSSLLVGIGLNDVAYNQNACANLHPAFDLTAS